MKDGWLIQLYPNDDHKNKLKHVIEKQAESHLCKKRVRDNKEDDQSECPNNTKRMKPND